MGKPRNITQGHAFSNLLSPIGKIGDLNPYGGGGGVDETIDGSTNDTTTYNPPYTDAEIQSWSCPTLYENIQALNQLMMQSRFTAAQAQVYQDTLNKMQNRYNTECILPDQPNQAPLARAGDAITIKLPVNTVELDGSSSSDPEAGELSFSWTQVSGPNAAIITSANTARPVVSNLIEGYYSFKLTVWDVMDASSSAMVNVTVLAADSPTPNPAPTPPTDAIEPPPAVPVVQTTINTTAPVNTPTTGPYGAIRGGGGGGGAGPAKPGSGTSLVPTRKTNWFMWGVIAFSAAGIAYIAFVKND